MKNENSLNMMKVWLALEVRQFIHALIQDVCIIWEMLREITNTKIHALVKADMISPNV